MVFSGLTFLFNFLPIVLIVYYLIPRDARNYWLLAASLFFYYWGAHEFLLVMVASILFNYFFALLISHTVRTRIRKLLLWADMACNVGILFYNKYLNLTTRLLHDYWNEDIVMTEIVLPIGISFFTFQAMSYVIDVYRKDVPVQKNPYKLGLFIALFPQLVAGPIVRYRTIADQIDNRRTTFDQFIQGVRRFLIGLSQKVLLANSFSIIADAAFVACTENRVDMSISFAWLGIIAYSLQILFDFSGYSSMAIGLGKMFGFEFLENFNYPYMASTIQDFWSRWHISLSRWFRDYVYFPLGGSRCDKNWKTYRNLLIVWLLTGIWHGANVTYLFWGLVFFFLLAFERRTKIASHLNNWGTKLAYRVFTLACIVLDFVLFRAESLRAAYHYYKVMVGGYGNLFFDNQALRYFWDYKFVFLIGILCCTPIMRHIREKVQEKYGLGAAVTFVYDCILVVFGVLSVSSLVMGGNNPFIYFDF